MHKAKDKKGGFFGTKYGKMIKEKIEKRNADKDKSKKKGLTEGKEKKRPKKGK